MEGKSLDGSKTTSSVTQAKTSVSPTVSQKKPSILGADSKLERQKQKNEVAKALDEERKTLLVASPANRFVLERSFAKQRKAREELVMRNNALRDMRSAHIQIIMSKVLIRAREALQQLASSDLLRSNKISFKFLLMPIIQEAFRDYEQEVESDVHIKMKGNGYSVIQFGTITKHKGHYDMYDGKYDFIDLKIKTNIGAIYLKLDYVSLLDLNPFYTTTSARAIPAIPISVKVDQNYSKPIDKNDDSPEFIRKDSKVFLDNFSSHVYVNYLRNKRRNPSTLNTGGLMRYGKQVSNFKTSFYTVSENEEYTRALVEDKEDYSFKRLAPKSVSEDSDVTYRNRLDRFVNDLANHFRKSEFLMGLTLDSNAKTQKNNKTALGKTKTKRIYVFVMMGVVDEVIGINVCQLSYKKRISGGVATLENKRFKKIKNGYFY